MKAIVIKIIPQDKNTTRMLSTRAHLPTAGFPHKMVVRIMKEATGTSALKELKAATMLRGCFMLCRCLSAGSGRLLRVEVAFMELS